MESSPRSYDIVSTNMVSLRRTVLRYPRVIELNVGTICACLPSLAAFYRHHRLKPSHIAAIKTITYRVNPFRSSRKVRDHRLETHILGSAQGEGKFLKSGDLSNITDLSDTHQIGKE